ncbi:unnamed protein product [Kluyveromyces dobzhanskii CBS 2104]|uniref:WGS project CCBQ000000000 data, contig 00015 n=1 Tax=Kluyveromyces dobzhanskii CBS 2104 TaxID=1427455 RepID=A0A0A8LA88_9SACH|nr:unnamed protein product [Kluyveromyces dobzhanskii CBS 2104]
MAKGKRTNWKRIATIAIPLIFAVVVLFKVFNNSTSAADLQTLLQNLPKEITMGTSEQTDRIFMEKFEKFSQDMLKKQDEQARRFDRERKVLEKKIQELKQAPRHATLREKLAVVFEYGTTQRFPAFVWQSWPYSDDDSRLDPILKKNERSWGNKNPGFVHEMINDDTAAAFVHYFYASIPEVIEAYDSLPTPILKIDFFKYLILLARGGVFADVDTSLLQPVPNWIPENVSPKEIGLVVGIEHDSKAPDWRSTFLRRLQFGNWIIQAKPGHPVIREMIAKVTETTLERKYSDELHMNLRNDLTIMSWTGSGAWTDVIFTYFNDYVQSGVLDKITWKHFHNLKVPKLVGDVLVFPEVSFNTPSSDADSDSKPLGSDSNKALHFATHSKMKSWKSQQKNDWSKL